MALSITATEVRNRLARCTTLDLSDTVLNSAGQIPVAIALINKMLDSGGPNEYDDLDSNEKVIAKAAAIDLAACRSLIFYPKPGGKEGPIEIKPLKSGDVKDFIDELKTSVKFLMNELGYNEWSGFGASAVGGDDYDHDGESLTNVLFTSNEKILSFFR